MELSQAWQTIRESLQETSKKLQQQPDRDAITALKSHLEDLEQQAEEIFRQHPEAKGKQPYEGDYRSLVADRFLCEIFLRLHTLRTKEGDVAAAREDFRSLAVKLLNLRADHGRFFDVGLNQQINRVEAMYQKLLKKG